jgi:hypothetical protein
MVEPRLSCRNWKIMSTCNFQFDMNQSRLLFDTGSVLAHLASKTLLQHESLSCAIARPFNDNYGSRSQCWPRRPIFPWWVTELIILGSPRITSSLFFANAPYNDGILAQVKLADFLIHKDELTTTHWSDILLVGYRLATPRIN